VSSEEWLQSLRVVGTDNTIVGDWKDGFADVKKVAKFVAMLCDEDMEMVNGGEFYLGSMGLSVL
jgi:hypothetical protein